MPPSAELLHEAIDLGITAFLLPVRPEAGAEVHLDPLARGWLALDAEQRLAPGDGPIGFCLEWRIETPLTPVLEGRIARALAPWLAHPRALRLGGRPLLIIAEPARLSHPRFGPRRIRAELQRAGLEARPLLLGTPASATMPATIELDGDLEDPWRDIPCLRVAGRIDYESFLFHAHHRPVPGRWRIPAVLPLPAGREPEFVHATPEAYHEWLQTSAAWSDLWHGGDPEALVLVANWPGHRRWGQGDPAVAAPSAPPAPAPAPAAAPALQERGWGEPDPGQVALLIHGFYLERLEEMLERLGGDAPFAFALYVSTPLEQVDALAALLLRLGWERVRIFGVPNRGRDMAPFLHHLLPAALACGHRWFVKLHTKRSPHLADGSDWGSALFDCLLAPEALWAILQRLEQDGQLGLLAPPGTLLPVAVGLGRNRAHLHGLLQGSGIEGPWLLGRRFICGSMMAGRLEALRCLLDPAPGLEAFEPEAGQTDGTLAHALERWLSVLVVRQGYRIEELAGDRAMTPAFGYRWARPTLGALPARE